MDAVIAEMIVQHSIEMRDVNDIALRSSNISLNYNIRLLYLLVMLPMQTVCGVVCAAIQPQASAHGCVSRSYFIRHNHDFIFGASLFAILVDYIASYNPLTVHTLHEVFSNNLNPSDSSFIYSFRARIRQLPDTFDQHKPLYTELITLRNQTFCLSKLSDSLRIDEIQDKTQNDRRHKQSSLWPLAANTAPASPLR